MSESDLQNKLAAARTRLILDKPFLGALVLRLPLVAADPKWCQGATTDARKLYYNQDYIDALDIQQTQFVLAKQALHCALSHFARRQHRIKHRWDLACDFAVNPLLIKDGLKAPPETLVDDGYEGMTAEEIYHYIDDLDNENSELNKENQDQTDEQNNSGSSQETEQQNSKQEFTLDDSQQDLPPSSTAHINDVENESPSLASQPSPLSPQEQEELSIQWQQRLAGAAQQAMQAGKLGGSMARMVDFMLQPKLPWRMLLARYMTATARDDYSYTRPSSRRGDPAIFPSMRSAQINIAVGIDTSGSIDEKEISEFMSEVDAIKANVRARITLLPCDSTLAKDAPWIFEPWEEVKLPTMLQGGGGTDFSPVFNWLDIQDQNPDLLVYFTDCQGNFPDVAPNYPVIWLVKGKSSVPWGQRVQLN
ncbi:MAG: VWA-like domain-containing protein [Gammaproteobacteria bacterium]